MRYTTPGLAAAICCLVLLLCGGCGGKDSTVLPELPTLLAAPLAYEFPSGDRLAAALADLAQAEAPDGIDAQAFEELKAALEDVLRASAKSGSTPPSGEVNVIDDLSVEDLGGGAADLHWTYKNRGDYDLNGEVGISDLTPIGQHLGKTSAAPDWDVAQAADGDGNGEVNVSDVTPIGQHYQAQVGEFHLYGGAAADGPWTFIDMLPFDAGDFSVYPPRFTWHLDQAEHPFYMVSPADFAGYNTIGSGGGEPAQYTPGTLTELAQATIGEDGGVLDAPAASPLEGVQVEVPAGAFPSDVEISLSVDSGSVALIDGVWEGEIVDVETGLTELFGEPLAITMPYSGGADYIPLPYYISDEGQLDACNITSWDPAAGEVTFESWHSSKFSIIKVARQQVPRPAYDTQFNVRWDGFQILNVGSKYTGGNCWGMSCFSRWYFLDYSHQGAEPVLFPTFMQPVGDKVGQDIIATRAQLSLERVFRRYYLTFFDLPPDFGDEDTFNIIRNMLLNTAAPVVVHLVGLEGEAHAVLAYAHGRDWLSIYDPNTPGVAAEIRIDELGFEWFTNGGITFSEFRYFGSGSLQTEPFEAILADAKAGFPVGEVPLDVLVGDLGNYDRSVDVRCTPAAAPVQIDWMRLHAVDSTTGAVTSLGVPRYFDSDQFLFRVPLHRGETRLYFETFSKKPNGELVKHFNSRESQPEVIVSEANPTAIFATLTWDSPDLRQDPWLIMIDPTNDYCWSENTFTTDGAQAYVSKSSGGGMGPVNNIALEVQQYTTVRWGQPYRFRVVNNASVRPYTFKLSISLNDGPAKEYMGFVDTWEGEWDWPPDPLTATGQMWWDGPTVIPQQP